MDKDYLDMFATSTSHFAFTSKLKLTFFLGLPLLRLGSDVSGGGWKLNNNNSFIYSFLCYKLNTLSMIITIKLRVTEDLK